MSVLSTMEIQLSEIMLDNPLLFSQPLYWPEYLQSEEHTKYFNTPVLQQTSLEGTNMDIYA